MLTAFYILYLLTSGAVAILIFCNLRFLSTGCMPKRAIVWRIGIILFCLIWPLSVTAFIAYKAGVLFKRAFRH